MITAKAFKKATGRDPVDDDLERVNCTDAGQFRHMSCGWCKGHNRPVYECGCNIENTEDN
jgi:hypothetical protein